MKLFRFWVQEPFVLQFGDREQPVRIWGGSNLSLEDARVRAHEKYTALVARVSQGASFATEAYEVAIREEIIEDLDAHNLVSRTRYGALVLNSENTIFIDVDRVPVPWGQALKALFTFQRVSREEVLIRHIENLSQTPDYASMTFRLYRTAKGFRIIATGQDIPPESSTAKKLFADFHADPLYARLCQKQRCYRARLTPKPSRIRCKSHKVVFPRNADQQASLEAWLVSYQQAASRYNVCRFVKTIGVGGDHRVVRYHDQMTRALKEGKLA